MVSVRLAEPDDISSMMKIAEGSDAAAHWSEARYSEIFTSFSRHRIAWVVEDRAGPESPAGNRKVIYGFLVAQLVVKDWEIENIAILPESRRRGYGSRLLSEFMQVTRNEGTESIVLEVRESNFSARAFYRRHGFEESGRRKMYYKVPEEDAIQYQLRFR